MRDGLERIRMVTELLSDAIPSGQQVTIAVRAGHSVVVGEEIGLQPDLGQAVLFDSRTGKLIPHGEGESPWTLTIVGAGQR